MVVFNVAPSKEGYCSAAATALTSKGTSSLDYQDRQCQERSC